jgi:hypothetical protein
LLLKEREMKRLLICLTSMMLGLAHGEVPKLFSQKSFTSASIAEAVNRYVAIGEAASAKEMEQLAAQENAEDGGFLGKGFSINERIGWVCRILYEPKGHSPLRAPKFGVLPLPQKTMPAEKWPLYPVAVSGSTYVILQQGYTPNGTPEEMAHYLAYCRKNGAFRTTPVEIPSKEQAEKDIANIRQSAQWQAIQWQNKDDSFSLPMGEELTWAFIKGQTRNLSGELVAPQNLKSDPSALSLR